MILYDDAFSQIAYNVIVVSFCAADALSSISAKSSSDFVFSVLSKFIFVSPAEDNSLPASLSSSVF